VIGFLDETFPGRGQTAAQVAFWNNQRERQWGVSPADREKIIPLIHNYRPVVTLQQVAGAGSGTTFRSFQSFGSTYFGAMRQAGFADYMSGARAA
jgi:hypothetical protein